MIDDNIIEFECEYGTASFAGYVHADEIGDDEPLHFYDCNMNSQSNILNAFCSGKDEDKEVLYEAFITDGMFLQFLADFADRSKVIVRPGYIIKIN